MPHQKKKIQPYVSLFYHHTSVLEVDLYLWYWWSKLKSWNYHILAAMKESFKRFLELVGDHDCEHRYVIHEGFHIYILKSSKVMKQWKFFIVSYIQIVESRYKDFALNCRFLPIQWIFFLEKVSPLWFLIWNSCSISFL